MQINSYNNFSFESKYPIIHPNELTTRIKKNYSYLKIARELNVPRGVVIKSIRHCPLASFNEQDVKMITDYYKRGNTAKKISELLNFHLKYVMFVIKKLEAEYKSDTGFLINSIMNKLNLDSSVLKNLKWIC